MKRIEERYISLLTDFGLKAYRDVKNSIDTALEKGREEGKNSKAIQIAKKMLDAGMDIETVMQITDLSKSKIEKLKWKTLFILELINWVRNAYFAFIIAFTSCWCYYTTNKNDV